ncbi:MAG: DNA mismatch repair protein MutS [Candidatus Lokiarchaeota archaeon]|nr:DNA mismatch repair protein MutS [Candidatus Lokiarchaeota archaeon]
MTTPMLKQYNSIKKQNLDAVLLFRVGDFYECYKKDAHILAECCKITLTSKEYGSKRLPMSGVPHHSINKYIKILIRNGYKVAICDQVEDASKKKGKVVKREVTSIVTPGTITDIMMLEDQDNNYLVSISKHKSTYGLTFVDVSTGEFFGTSIRGKDEEDTFSKLLSELIKFNPTEAIMPKSLFTSTVFIEKLKKYTEMIINEREDYEFELDYARDALKEHFNVVNLKGFGCEDDPAIIMSAGGVIKYLEDIKKTKENNIKQFSIYNREDYMIIDAASQRNLELVKNIMEDTKRGTLLSVLNKTITPMGSRKLKRWIKQPLLDIEKIKYRQERIEEFREDLLLREDVREHLKEVYDIERLIGKISHDSANARDLVALKNSINKVPEIQSILAEKTSLLGDLLDDELINEVLEAAEIIDKSIKKEPAANLHEGNIIKKGYNEELDKVLKLRSEGKDFLMDLENEEKKKTGIKSLKIKFNKVFGYFIEVTNPNLDLVPEDRYIRKQTLTNSERFFTEDLKKWEEKIIGAEEKVNELEYEIFKEILENIKGYTEYIQKISNKISEIDIFACLAEVAVQNNYIKPKVTDSSTIKIKKGRHPVLDVMLPSAFIPNDVLLDNDENQLLIITGPNMAGKSTYLRQVAQIIILAQMGSFIPAEEAEIGIVDQIFVRVGAYDNIVLQQSTFLVEMNETANILNNAKKKSLIILDEIGRGTATFDGLSIAWAVTEYIVKDIGARTLFATHYHQLNELSDYFDSIKNYNIIVKRKEHDIIFLYKIRAGGCDRSYGVQVAKLAGIPQKVVSRAKEILESLEKGNEITIETKTRPNKKVNKGKRLIQLRFSPVSEKPEKPIKSKKEEKIFEEIKNLEIEKLTPIDALNKLYEIKKRIKSDENDGNE